MDVYIVSQSLKPSPRELPSLLNYYRPFRNIHERTSLVTEYMEIGGFFVTGVDIHDDDIYVQDTIVFVVDRGGPERDLIVEQRIHQMVRAIGDYRKGIVTEATRLSDEIAVCKIMTGEKHIYEGADYDTIEAAYVVRTEKLNIVAP